MNRNKIYAIGSAVALLGVLGGTYLFTAGFGPDDPYAGCRTTKVSTGSASIGGPFTLVSETGETVTDIDVITKPTLVYFGYTFCPDVCPVDTARNAEAVEILSTLGHDVLPVFITVDPERDTVEVMAEYTDYMHPDMLGLTGSPEQIKAAAQAYLTYYRKQEAEDEYYLVDHMTFTYLMMPETGFLEFFRRDLTPEQMAKQTACFLDVDA